MRKLLVGFLVFVVSKVAVGGCYYDFASFASTCNSSYQKPLIGICVGGVIPEPFLSIACVPTASSTPLSDFIYLCHHLVDLTRLQHYRICSNPEAPKTQSSYSSSFTKNSCGSIIQVDNQALVEKIPLAGSSYYLTYSSLRIDGRKDWYKAEIPATRSDYITDPNVVGISIDVKVEGRTFSYSLSQAPGVIHEFVWDGKNDEDENVDGSVDVDIEVYERQLGNMAYTYPIYTETGVSGSKSSLVDFYYIPVKSNIFLGTIFKNDRTMGGWYFSEHHLYDNIRETLYLGDGSSYNVRAITKSNGDYWIVSEDRSKVFVFNSNFVHIRTLDAITGVTELTLNYDANDKLLSVIDKFSNLTTFNYAGDDLISIVSPDGLTTNFTHDSDGFIATATNPNSEVYAMTYSSDGLLLSFQKPNSIISTFNYDIDGLLISDLSSAGSSTVISRVSLNDGDYQISEESKLGRLEETKIFRSDENYNREEIYPNGYFSKYIEHSTANFDRYTNSSNFRHETGYQKGDRFGDNNKFTSYYNISDGGVLFSASYSEIYTLSDLEDPFSFSSLTSIWRVNEQNYTSVYTPSSNEIVEATPMGKTTTTSLGILGEITSIIPYSYESIDFQYDSRGRVTEVSQGLDRNVLFSYHPTTGFLQSIENALGETTSFTHDGVGRILTETLPDSRVVSYSYDAIGNLTSVTPPGKSAHSMIYSGHGPLATYNPPALGSSTVSTNYFYSDDRELIQINRPNGDEIEFNYGPITGSLDSIDLPTGSRTFFYNNGIINQSVSEDFVTRNISISGTKISNESFSIGSSFWSVRNDYTSDLLLGYQEVRIGFFSYPLYFTYDNDLFLTTAGSQTYTRSPVNGTITNSNLNEVEEAYTYSTSFGELASHSAKYQTTSLYEMSVVRDDLGRITSKTETYASSSPNTYVYSYDLAGRLVNVTLNGNPKSAYIYDSNSNRTSQTIDATTTLATYDDHDRLLNFGTKSFTYNLNGELTSMTEGSDVTNFTYDAFGNLKQVETPTLTVNYKVDAHNRRIQKLLGTTAVEYYVWNADNQLLASVNDLGNLKARFVYGSKSHSPDYMIKDGVEYKIVTDHLGSPVVVVNSTTGVVAQEIKYDEFGKILSDTNPGFTPFGFAGCLYDQDTKLCRFGARDYDATIGRWLSKDPILFAGGDTNLYGYVLQDPVNLIDPSGNVPILPVLGIIGGVGIANAFGSAVGTIIAGGSGSDAWASAKSGFISGALTGASALGALAFGIPAGAATIITGIVTNITTSVMGATGTLGRDLPQGHKNFAEKVCQ